MSEQEKQELLIAISGYLPYGLKLDILARDNPDIHSIDQVRYDNVGTYERLIKNEDSKFDIKPYLRPMSSMTDEERKEENKLWDIITKTRNDLHYLYTDFLLFHHLDYRGLIEKGLALIAPKNMYTL
jgi:hypothetical protein